MTGDIDVSMKSMMLKPERYDPIWDFYERFIFPQGHYLLYSFRCSMLLPW
jgi:hypothetical protein